MKTYIPYEIQENETSPRTYLHESLIEEEKIFIKWTEALQRTLSILNQNIKNYNILIKFIKKNTQTYDNYYNFFTTLLYNITRSIVLDFCSLIGNKNKLQLTKYNNFCNDEAKNIFNISFDNLFIENRKKLSSIYKFYKEKLRDVRNQYFGHLSVDLLNTDNLDNLMSNVTINEIEAHINTLNEVLSTTWHYYSKKSICLKLKNFNDLRQILEQLKNTNTENIK